MKKLIILFATFCLVSCINENRVSDHKTYDSIPWDYVTEYTYKGHNYIKFKENGGYAGGVVHNPDCPCFKDTIK